jgi:hypothetical protein
VINKKIKDVVLLQFQSGEFNYNNMFRGLSAIYKQEGAKGNANFLKCARK